MISDDPDRIDERVLVHAPRGRDAFVVSQVLSGQGLRVETCATLEAFSDALEAGAGIAFLTEESLVGSKLERLHGWLQHQPPWSDFPFVVLASRRIGRRPSDATGALAGLGNVVLLERPLNSDTLVSAAHSALRARRRQYQTRAHLAQQEAARLAERLASEEAVRANEALELAVGAGELGTFHCPMPLGHIEWNVTCKAQFWLPADAEVDLERFYAILHEDDREPTRAAIGAAVNGDRPYDVEYRTVSATGQWRWIRAKGRVYRDADGRPTRFDGITLDITRQKGLEAERERLLASEREARTEAERASRMKDQFLATLSHELRTPLSAILGWTHLLSRQQAPGADLAKAVATIDRNARAQARLIEELLDVSRITSGNLKLEVKQVALASVIDAVVASLKLAADAKAIALELEVSKAIGDIEGDPHRLQQVVWNLLSNAIKFTPTGGRVRLTAARSGAIVEMEVQDNGAGIPAEFLPHVFERFRQADASEARAHGGLGLGLAIVRHLVELHHGSVEARSEGVGQGATFRVRLPAPRRPAAIPALQPRAEPRPAAAAATDLAGVRILLVDDEADGREMLARVLESQGAIVSSAGSADAALAALRGSAPDILISDIGMPHVDGYEMMRRIRAFEAPRGGGVPAIALTAFASRDDAARAISAGYRAHLAKPVEPAELYATVVSLLQSAPGSGSGSP